MKIHFVLSWLQEKRSLCLKLKAPSIVSRNHIKIPKKVFLQQAKICIVTLSGHFQNMEQDMSPDIPYIAYRHSAYKTENLHNPTPHYLGYSFITKESSTQETCYLTQDTKLLPKLKRLLLWFIQRRNQKGEHLEA